MCNGKRRFTGGGEDIYILSNGLGLHERHRTGEQRLRAVVRWVGGGEAIRVHRTPALRTFKFHAVETHGLLRHILDVDLKEYFFAFERVEKGRRGFRRVDFGLDGQGIGDLFPCVMRSTREKTANGNAPQTCRIFESSANSGRPHPRRVPGHKNTQAEVGT